MATATDIIKRSLRIIGQLGTGETPDASEAADALTALNAMLGQWSIQRLAVYEMVTDTLTIAAGTATYTIGPGGTWNTGRPIKINTAVVRDDAGTDYSLEPMSSIEYQGIGIKDTESNYPSRYYYSPGVPLASFTLYPVPTLALSLILTSWRPLAAFATGAANIVLPPGYEDALAYNLAVNLAPEYGIGSVNPIVLKKAVETLSHLKTINEEIPLMQNDAMYLSSSRGGYDIYQDGL
jgi:hypothetical protein